MHTFQCKLIKHPTTAWDRDKLTLVLDGEPLLESWVHKPIIVHEQETPIVGRTMRAGSVDASRLLAKIPIAELLAEFETVHVSIEPEIGEFIGNDVAITRRKVDGIRNSRILFEISLEDGNQDAISIDSNPLRRLLGKLIASRFPSPRRAIIPVGEPAKAGAGEGPGEGRQQGLPDRPEPLSVSHGTSPVAVPKGFYPPL